MQIPDVFQSVKVVHYRYDLFFLRNALINQNNIAIMIR